MKNQELVNLLIKKGYKISAAESCTGGMFVSSLVDISDASKVLDESYVTYANEAKVKILGVKEETIEAYGVVSEEVAKEMAIGVAKISNSEVGVGISGIAGPTGGTLTKPIGMVCFGFKVLDKVITKTMYFGNVGRNKVRNLSVEYAINTLLSLLEA